MTDWTKWVGGCSRPALGLGIESRPFAFLAPATTRERPGRRRPRRRCHKPAYTPAPSMPPAPPASPNPGTHRSFRRTSEPEAALLGCTTAHFQHHGKRCILFSLLGGGQFNKPPPDGWIFVAGVSIQDGHVFSPARVRHGSCYGSRGRCSVIQPGCFVANTLDVRFLQGLLVRLRGRRCRLRTSTQHDNGNYAHVLFGNHIVIFPIQ